MCSDAVTAPCIADTDGLAPLYLTGPSEGGLYTRRRKEKSF